MDQQKLKEKIIHFIQNSPDEVNFNVASFIAGMQVQKKLISSGLKSDNHQFLPIKDNFTGEETCRREK